MTIYELTAEYARLKAKYPPEVYASLKREPEDILAYTRNLIRFGPKKKSEYVKLIFIGDVK